MHETVVNIKGQSINIVWLCSDISFQIPPPTAAFGVPALTVRRYVVKMFGTIYYKTGCLLVRDTEGEVVHTIRGVSSLQVINRFSTNRRLFHASSGITFNGYGEVFTLCSLMMCISRSLGSGFG